MADKTKITRYKPFPKHDNKGLPENRQYHSSALPDPNIVRIEVLSPHVKARYLGKFHSMMDGFRQELANSIMTPDANRPFLGFFDPAANGDIGFDLQANWVESKDATFEGMAQKFNKFPGIGKLASWGAGAAKVGTALTREMGLDNISTGSCTMKTFSKASFAFNKTVKCSWYMPEMEAQARVGITRLLKMCYVRNLDPNMRTNYARKVANALSAVTNQLNSFNEPGEEGGVVNTVVGGAMNLMSEGLEAVDSVVSIDKLVNTAIDINEFFGGSLTVAPMPVRLTMGHILDIEPLVITNVKVSGSKEQFMTTDGTNIPLFVTADIQFAMWMLPDPNKGFVRWLGDDVFNIGYTNAQSTSAPATGNARPAGKSTDSKPVASGKRAAVPGAGSAASNPKLKK